MKPIIKFSRPAWGCNILAGLAVLVLALSGAARATLFVYEGFNYPTLADNTALSVAALNGMVGQA